MKARLEIQAMLGKTEATFEKKKADGTTLRLDMVDGTKTLTRMGKDGMTVSRKFCDETGKDRLSEDRFAGSKHEQRNWVETATAADGSKTLSRS